MKIVLQIAVCMLPVCAFAQTTTSYSLQEIGKYEIHQVKKGETLYSLSRQFQTTVPSLLELNPNIVDNKLKSGSTIKVPKAAAVNNTASETSTYKGIGPKPFLVPVYYQVAKGETLYSIGQKTNNDVEVVKLWNDLKANNIKPGQKLIVGYAENTQTLVGTPRVTDNSIATTTKPSVPVTQTATKSDIKKTNASTSGVNKEKVNATAIHKETVATKPIETVKEKPIVTASTTPVGTNTEIKTGSKSTSVYNTNPSTAKLVYVNEKGICTWTRGSSENGSFYALHPTAPIGSTISVKNMMNSRSVQVKVIGRLPNTPENENIAIKISGSAAKELNALDSKFLSQMSYMGYEAQKPSKS